MKRAMQQLLDITHAINDIQKEITASPFHDQLKQKLATIPFTAAQKEQIYEQSSLTLRQEFDRVASGQRTLADGLRHAFIDPIVKCTSILLIKLGDYNTDLKTAKNPASLSAEDHDTIFEYAYGLALILKDIAHNYDLFLGDDPDNILRTYADYAMLIEDVLQSWASDLSMREIHLFDSKEKTEQNLLQGKEHMRAIPRHNWLK
jgi:hypothetical protein